MSHFRHVKRAARLPLRILSLALKAARRRPRLRVMLSAPLLPALVLSTASLGAALLLAPPQPAGSYLVFGPEDYVRGEGQPVIETRTFTVARPGAGLLRIHNGGSAGQFGRDASAYVNLNNKFVAMPSDFNRQVGVVERSVTLAAQNTLQVKVAEASGSGITVEIYGFDDDRPTIIASAQPAANAAGWNATDVTVSFSCADATSGIAACPAPVVVTTEGAGQTVRGTARDRAGNTASAAVTLNVDKTPPALSITSPADGAAQSGPSVVVSGTAADALSGLTAVNCNGAAARVSGATFACDLVLGEGTNTIEAVAVDRAGNIKTASITVTLDIGHGRAVVPDVLSLTHRAAQTALTESNLNVGALSTAYSDTVPAGRVIGQTPAAGTQVAEDSPVDLVLSLGRAGATPPVSFSIDASVAPDQAEISPLSDGVRRRLASVVDERGHQVDFVEDELLLMTNDAAAVTSFVARWQGQILRRINPSPTRLAGLSPMYHVRINTSLADPAAIVADLRAFTTVGRGHHRVTSEAGLRLLAAAQMERADGLLATPNWMFESQDIPNRSTAEDGSSPFNGTDGTSYGNNAFAWPYMDRGSKQDIGVGEAWRTLAQTGRINNRVSVMIYDSGFDTTNRDISPNRTLLGQIDRAGPARCPNISGSSGPCPWHGTAVVEAGMALPDNNFGVAGPGGPVSELILVGSPSLDLAELANYLIDVQASLLTGPDIINMSFGFDAPALLSVAPDELFHLLAAAFRTGGTLLIAAAGNQGQDVDAEDCLANPFGIDICWEEAAWLPCETSGVMCVGGLDWDSTGRAPNSNYGSQPDDCCTVDIYGPYTLFLLTDPTVSSLTRNVALRNGTSYSAPFVAGVAALVWAANPDLSDGEVENILINTAHTDSIDQNVPRWVNAYAAVLAALPNDPPTAAIRAPADGATVGRGVDIEFVVNADDHEDSDPSVNWTSDLDGTIGTGRRFTVNNLSFGTHHITATVTDSGGFSDTATVVLHIINDQPPVVSISAPADRGLYQRSETINFAGTSFDPNNLNPPNTPPSPPPPPERVLADAEVSWSLDGSGMPFANGHRAALALSSLRPGVHVVTFTGDDRRGNATFTASDFISFNLEPDGPLPGQPPAASINYPADGATFGPFDAGNNMFAADVALGGEASDPEDGPLPPGSLVWTTRRAGGDEETLGFGNQLTARLYTAGLVGTTEHLITLYATDSDGNVTSQSVRVLIVFPDADGDGLHTDEELRLNTDPYNVDTDADGVWDGAEIFLATDPLSNPSRPGDIPAGTLFASTSGFPGGAALTLIDPDTGSFGVLGRPPGIIGGFGLAFKETGTLYISTGARLRTFDPLTGASNEVGQYTTPTGAALSVLQLAYNPSDGMLYGIEEGPAPFFLSTGQLVRINPATAQAERVGDGSANPRVNALAFTPGGTLYGVAEGTTPEDSGRLVEIRTGDGLVTRDVGPIGSANVFGLTFDRGGRLLAGRFVANDEGELLNVSTTDGAGAHLSSVGRPVFGMTVKPCSAPCLAAPGSVPLSGFVSFVEAADFNGDGLLDVAAVASSPDRVALLRGNGDGTFQPPLSVLLPTSSGPASLAVADLNGDGRADVVTANRTSQNVSVLLGDGAGALLAPTQLPVGGPANTLNSVAVADMTNDGRPDILAGASRSVALLVGDGAGHFGAPLLTTASQFNIRSLAVANLDGDVGAGGLPALDVVTAHTDGRVAVLYGDGAGNFPRRAESLVAFSPGFIALGDLNGDGRADVVVPDVESQQVFVALNDGAGNLLPRTGYRVGPNGVVQRPLAARIADLTGDGRADVATANNLTNSVSVLYGDGQGTLAPALRSPFGAGVAPQHLAFGDLNGDGLPDLVIANGQGGISVLLNSRAF